MDILWLVMELVIANEEEKMEIKRDGNLILTEIEQLCLENSRGLIEDWSELVEKIRASK